MVKGAGSDRGREENRRSKYYNNIDSYDRQSKMTRDELVTRLESMKGLAGSGNILGDLISKISDFVGTMEPGDIVASNQVTAAPITYDLWYLFYHQNFMRKYYAGGNNPVYKFFNYVPYMTAQLGFLRYLPGLKPLKVFTDLDKQLKIEDVWLAAPNYTHRGIYWINTLFFELMSNKKPLRYPSEGSKGYQINPNDYVGYVAFPVGQLGVMEVVSLFQETQLKGHQFAAYNADPTYYAKPAMSGLKNEYVPAVQSTPEMFSDMKDKDGNQLAGMNYCFGRHLIESAYYKPEYPVASQNSLNSNGTTAYAPIADKDVELWASGIKDYGEDIAPKKWMRYWIHKDSTLPVPGEFLGILVRPVAAPPHVWWFQESSPLLYAGNWVETNHFTSGVITSVTLEKDRPAGSVGNEYKVKIQGVEIIAYATDFFLYAVGDRVAILKKSSLGSATQSFSSLEQSHFKETKGITISTIHIIVPMTFYKIKH
jgi:hypothetical protein